MNARTHMVGLVLLMACVDYEFQTPNDGSGKTDDTSTPEEQTPNEPPFEVIDECPDGATASLTAGVYVLSWDPSDASGSLEADAEGWYHLYDYALSESGTSQTNESGYLRVPNDGNPDGLPRWANCESEWVQVDQDNAGTPTTGARSYLGTFWLEEGPNTFTFHHFCPLYRSGVCADLHETSDSESTCDSSNGNSVHFEGEGICIVLADE